MKDIVLIATLIIIIVILSACGPAPVPALSVTDVQNTAVSLAQTEISLTKTALPTPTLTPLPPTPMPTFTPAPTLPLPPTPITSGSNPGAVGGATHDPCGDPAPSDPKGTTVQVKFVNKSGGTVNLAFGMYQPDSLGECGIYSFSLGVFESPVVRILEGCYWGYAWVTGKKPSTAQTMGSLCFTDPNQTRSVTIGTEVIDFNP